MGFSPFGAGTYVAGYADGVPLIHGDSFSSRAVMPSWADWFAAAGVRDADVSRGLQFNSADHALDATVEGAGVLLAHDVLAYDDLRTGHLVAPFDLTLPSGRCYCFVCAKKRRESANVRAFRVWLKEEAAAPSTGVSARRAQPIDGPRRDCPRRANSVRLRTGSLRRSQFGTDPSALEAAWGASTMLRHVRQ